MTIARLFNHNAVVYRATTSRDPFGGTVETWAALSAPAGPNGFNCRPDQNWSGALQDHGPGEQQGASRRWFMHRGFDVRERDVVSVEEGAEAPALLWVESVTKPTRRSPAVHHLEVNVEVWQGDLAEPEAAPPDEPEVLSVEF
jgi:hypothetical protein